MALAQSDVWSLIEALSAVADGLDRAGRGRKPAGALSLLPVIHGHDGIRPTDIAAELVVHPSLVTRQLRQLERSGYVQVTADPGDGRSWRVSLTEEGLAELGRLQEASAGRFAPLVADWEPEEARTLTALLEKLRASLATASEAERERARSDGHELRKQIVARRRAERGRTRPL